MARIFGNKRTFWGDLAVCFVVSFACALLIWWGLLVLGVMSVYAGAVALTKGAADSLYTSATKFNNNRAWVSVMDYGAKLDGVTDDSAAFVAAAATGHEIFVPKTGTAIAVLTQNIECAGLIMESGAKILQSGSGKITVSLGNDSIPTHLTNVWISSTTSAADIICIKRRRVYATGLYIVGTAGNNQTGVHFDTTASPQVHHIFAGGTFASVDYPFKVDGTGYFNNNEIGPAAGFYAWTFEDFITFNVSGEARQNTIGAYLENGVNGVVFDTIPCANNTFKLWLDTVTYIQKPNVVMVDGNLFRINSSGHYKVDFSSGSNFFDTVVAEDKAYKPWDENVSIPLTESTTFTNISGMGRTFTHTRTTSSTARDVYGEWASVPASRARFTFTNQSTTYGDHWTPTGYLAEGGVTNYVLNSGSPATQTVTLADIKKYTLWVEGTGSCAIAANTAVGTGFGAATEGSPITVDITTGGTVDLTVTGSLTRFQLENKDFTTSYFPTTGVSLTRDEDQLSTSPASVVYPIAGTAYVEVTPHGSIPGVQPATRTVIGFPSGAYILSMNGASFRAYDGTNLVVRNFTYQAGKTYRMAVTWGNGAMTVYNLTDGTSTTGTYNGGFTDTTLKIGGSVTNEAYCSIKNLRFVKRPLSLAELRGIGADGKFFDKMTGKAPLSYHTNVLFSNISTGDVLKYDGTNWANDDVDHGNLTGLADDDHPQYLQGSRFTSYSGFQKMPKSGGTFTGAVSFTNADVVFNHLKAEAMSCDNGATLPSSPATGQWFLHTPAGRANLMIYNGSSWTMLSSFGATTLYVDGTDGTDSQDKGFGVDTDAFATIQYAVNQIPAMFDGHVTVNIAAGTYRETVTVQGKWPTAAYNISFAGEWTTTLADTTATSGAQRTSATASASITTTGAGWTSNAYQYKMLYIASGTGSGQYRPILSNTTDTIYVEAWATVPDSTSHFIVYDWATRVTGSDAGADTTAVRQYIFDIGGNQANVYIENLLLNYALTGTGAAINIAAGANNANIKYCHIHNMAYGVSVIGSIIYNYSNYIHNTGTRGVLASGSSFVWLYDNHFLNCTTNGVWGALAFVQLIRNRFDLNSAGKYGVYLYRNAVAATGVISNQTCNSFVNYGTNEYGIFTERGGYVSDPNLQYYSAAAGGTDYQNKLITLNTAGTDKWLKVTAFNNISVVTP